MKEKNDASGVIGNNSCVKGKKIKGLYGVTIFYDQNYLKFKNK